MPGKSLITILLSTFLAMAALYSPQPLLPYFARVFEVSEAESASLISLSLLSMSIGPLFMGVLLQRYSPRLMLLCCLTGLLAATIAFSLLDSFVHMKWLRFVKGGIIAAQLAATMTYITSASTRMGQVMAYYVGAAIMGGLSGRLLAGFISEYASWRFFFAGLGVLFVVCLWQAFYLPDVQQNQRKTVSLKAFSDVLRDGYILRMYMIIALAFFVMTGILNYIPFRLEELSPAIGESRISLFYLGFVLGCIVTINAPRIADRVGGAFHAAKIGILSVFLGLLLAFTTSVALTFWVVTLVTCGFFLQHTSIATLLNRYAGERAGVVNSLYISVYYFGGSAGAYLPGLIYESYNWMMFTILLILVIILSAIVAQTVKVVETLS